MKTYIIRVNDDYLFHIDIVNCFVKTAIAPYMLTNDKSVALSFKKKYLASAIARLVKGKVEELK